MAGVHQGPKGAPAPLRGGAPQTYFDRRVHRREGPDTRAAVLPPELGFIAAGHGVSPQHLLAALETAPLGVRPLDAVLKEGILPEDVYYRALARHLGCEYYRGDQPFGPGFDAVKSLQTGVAPLYGGGRSARAVIAPGARSVSGLIEMTASGRLHPASFALTSPQHFASFVRTQRGEAILAEALERLEAKWSAKGGMSGGQIAAAGLIGVLAIGLGVANLQTLAASLAVLSWAIFLTSIMLRSMATVADGATPRPRRLTDDECPLYTIVAPVYREVEVVDDLINALDALDYPGIMAQTPREK
jgi:glycosyltransferase XagB